MGKSKMKNLGLTLMVLALIGMVLNYIFVENRQYDVLAAFILCIGAFFNHFGKKETVK